MCFGHNRLVITLLLLVASVSYCYGCNSFLFASLAPRTCNLRCNRRPTLLDYDCPFGCYCHDTCGGSLPCCGDKNRYCGSSFVSGGQQSCIIPKRVRSAKIVGEEKTFYTIGESITYECNFHYVMDGSSTRTCIFRNVWSPGPPSCSYELHVCRPLDIKDGFVSETKKQFLNYESVRVWCKDGYVLQGSSRSTCVRSRWSPSTPRCFRDWCSTMSCSADATCTNLQFRGSCRCKDGFTGSGYTCTRIPCYNHGCTENKMCVDSGDGSGRYTCECKDGFITFEEKCIADPCLSNDCHENATCVVTSDTYECSCTDGYIGNGTTCNERLCNSTAIYGEEIEQPCAACEDICCDDERIRDCRICIHMQCNGGEVCGEDTSRIPTVCSAVQCFENKGSGGFTVDTPDNVVCFNDEGKPNEDMHCCWIGE